MNSKKFDTKNYEFNKGSKIGVYLIHGFSSTTYEMKVLANFLKDKNYHVVLNNLPGHGTTVQDCNKTTYQEWLDYSKIEFAKLASSVDSIFVIGGSLGGVVALYLSTVFPVKGIIVGGTVLEFQKSFYTKYINPFMCRLLKSRPKKLIYPKGIRSSIQFYGYDNYPLIAYNEFKKMNQKIKARLSKVKAPILIIHSSSDRMSIKANVHIIKQGINSKYKEILNIQRAHHNMFDTNPDTDKIFGTCDKFIKKYL